MVDGITTITINADDGLGGTVATSFNVIVSTMITSIEQVGDEMPDKYALFQNFPNPFNPELSLG